MRIPAARCRLGPLARGSGQGAPCLRRSRFSQCRDGPCPGFPVAAEAAVMRLRFAIPSNRTSGAFLIICVLEAVGDLGAKIVELATNRYRVSDAPINLPGEVAALSAARRSSTPRFTASKQHPPHPFGTAGGKRVDWSSLLSICTAPRPPPKNHIRTDGNALARSNPRSFVSRL